MLWGSLFNEFGRKFKSSDNWFYACGSSAALKPFCFMLAEVPPHSNHFVLCLRKFRSAQTVLFYARGSSAALKPFCFILAEVPRRRNHFVLCLRKFRGVETVLFYARGSSARPKLFGFTLVLVIQRFYTYDTWGWFKNPPRPTDEQRIIRGYQLGQHVCM